MSIHNEPMRKGLISESKEYEFSSISQYNGKGYEKVQLQIDRVDKKQKIYRTIGKYKQKALRTQKEIKQK